MRVYESLDPRLLNSPPTPTPHPSPPTLTPHPSPLTPHPSPLTPPPPTPHPRNRPAASRVAKKRSNNRKSCLFVITAYYT